MGDAGYFVEQQWHSKPRHMRVVCVGAGAAGLMVAYKLKRNCKIFDLVIYDK
jgi:cation diffusion facilitator CzcD-associated flavoprotein CzcO